MTMQRAPACEESHAARLRGAEGPGLPARGPPRHTDD